MVDTNALSLIGREATVVFLRDEKIVGVMEGKISGTTYRGSLVTFALSNYWCIANGLLTSPKPPQDFRQVITLEFDFSGKYLRSFSDGYFFKDMVVHSSAYKLPEKYNLWDLCRLFPHVTDIQKEYYADKYEKDKNDTGNVWAKVWATNIRREKT